MTDKNWVEEQGGLPSYIKRIVKHLQENGMTEGHAIAVAVNAAKRMCATGDTNFPGVQQVNPGSRAEACAAVAEWEAMKARAGKRSDAVLTKDGEVLHKTFNLIETKALDDAGAFTALASVFNNVDLVGDRMKPGAFQKTLERWRGSGDPIPVILSHLHDDPMAMIGKADPRAVYETDEGLVVQGQLDLENPTARQVYKLMKERLLKGWSFGYTVPRGGQKRAGNGVNDVYEVDLIEVGPTLKGANPAARTEAIKSVNVARKNQGLAPLVEEEDEVVVEMKSTDKAWDGSASRFTDEQYASSCILDRADCGSSDLPAKQRYSLPILEPGGTLNSNAVYAAAARIDQTKACPKAIANAKSKLRRAYSQLGEEAPDSLKSVLDIQGKDMAEIHHRLEQMEVDLLSTEVPPRPVDPPALPKPPVPTPERKALSDAELRERIERLEQDQVTSRAADVPSASQGPPVERKAEPEPHEPLSTEELTRRLEQLEGYQVKKEQELVEKRYGNVPKNPPGPPEPKPAEKREPLGLDELNARLARLERYQSSKELEWVEREYGDVPEDPPGPPAEEPKPRRKQVEPKKAPDAAELGKRLDELERSRVDATSRKVPKDPPGPPERRGPEPERKRVPDAAELVARFQRLEADIASSGVTVSSTEQARREEELERLKSFVVETIQQELAKHNRVEDAPDEGLTEVKSTAQDPLRKRAQDLEFEIFGSEVPRRQRERKAAEPPRPSMEVDELRERSHSLMLQVLSGLEDA